MTNHKSALRVRPWLFGGAAFLAAMSLTGCGSMESIIPSESSRQSIAPVASAASSVPMTTVSSEDSTALDGPAEANHPASVSAMNTSPAVGSASDLAYGTATDEHVVMADAQAPTVNQYGELDGKTRSGTDAPSQMSLQQHTFVTEGCDSDVSIDPSGRWIVFASTRHNTHPQIYLQRVDGSSVVQLTSDSSDHAFPCFSNDGKQIAFCSTRAGAGDWDIYVMDLDGRNVVQVTSGPSQDLHPSFSPDGKRLVYCSMGPRSSQWELWMASAQSSEKRMIGYGLFPSWSPNKSKDQIAFQRARQRGSRWFSLWTLDLVDGEACRVTEVAVSANAAIVSPSWCPDGQRIAFSTIVDPAMMNGKGKPSGQTDIWTVNVDGSNRRRLTDGNGASATPCWSADNRVYFVSDRGGVECVWSAQADKGAAPAMAATETQETQQTHH